MASITLWKPTTAVADEVEDTQAARRRADADSRTALLDPSALACLADREAKLAARVGRPLAVILFDLDALDLINLRHGYDLGDRVLREVETIVRHAMRDTDLFARVRDDEFMIVLPDTPRERATEIAESLRARLAEIGAGVPDLRVSACFGVASLVPDDERLECIQTMAQSALGRAKQKGCNRVESSNGVALRPRAAA